MRKTAIGGLMMMLSILVGSLTVWAAGNTYINGIDANFPPFAYVDQTGKPAGLDVDAIEWIAKKMGFKVTHQPMDWDGIIPSLNAKKIDFIASGMTITEERAKVVNFSIPYHRVENVFVAKADSALTTEQIQTKGGKIGVQRGTSEAERLEEAKKKNNWAFELVYYDSAPMAVGDVLNGRIIAAAMNDAPAQDAVKKQPVKIIGLCGIPVEEFGIAVRKEDKNLLETLNTGLKMLMADPYWQELKDKYIK